MNKIDLVPPSETIGIGESPPPQRRPPPKAAKFVLPVWGYGYVRQFLECGLPTLLAPGNVPGVAAALPTEFVILTSADDEPFIREHAAFKRLTSVCRARFHLIDHLITDGNYSTTITLAYTETVRENGDAMLDTCFFFLVSDYIVADGSLKNALTRMQRGTSAIVTGNFQVVREDALPWLEDRLTLAKHVLALPPRELMAWSLNHLHPATLANTVNISFSHNSHTNRLFWRVDSATVLARFYLMHMLCVRPEITDFVIGASCDYSFVPEMCPSGNVEALTDSDEYLVIEMQPRGHEAAFLRPGPLPPALLAKSLGEWTTTVHRDNARYCLVFHADDVPPDIEQSVAQCDAYIADVARRLPPKAKPIRGHPYWHGAMAAFHDATGRKLNMEEWRYALGLPPREDWLSQWFLWRAKNAFMGRPPHVLPWHPNWPDYKAVLKEIEPFFSDPTQRMLMLSNEPTVFTVALADSGERVHRLRCTPFLKATTKRFEPLREKFDLCLLELSEGDMIEGDQLTDRIVPLMKKGGRIVVFVANRRSVVNAHEFSNGVSYHGTRFMRSGALPTSIQFIPASRLRWVAHRGLIRLRGLAGRYPVFGLPVAAVFAGVFLTGSLIGNIDALRPSRRVAPRGIASSFLLRLTVDRHDSEVAPAASPLSPVASLAEKGGPPTLEATDAQPRSATDEHTREPQYDRCIEVKNLVGLTPLGLMTNQVWYDDPRRLTFLLSRYKFVAKMLSGRANAAEVGCGDAFGTRVVLQEVPDVTVYDFDPVFIEDIRNRYDARWPLKAKVHDIVAAPLPRKYEAVFSLDVIEHIASRNEHAYLANLRGSLAPEGVLIIGTPSIESQAYASPLSKAGHVNCKSGKELKVLVQNYFSRVFLFSMNDEVVHTGFSPLAHYLFVICDGPK